MNTTFRAAVVSFCLIFMSLGVNAQEQCSTVNCDCASLPTESWATTCKNQEARLIADCVKSGEVKGFCSLHGPLANRLPLDLDIEAEGLFALEEIPKLNNRVGVLYWAIIKDFDSLEAFVKTQDFARANEKLNTLVLNIEELFETQLQVGNSLTADSKPALAQLAWRDYSADSLSIASDFFIRAESLLNTYDGLTDATLRDEARDLGLRLMEMSGKVYEQVGHSYASGMRHKHAAKAWKNAADASALVMAHATSNSVQHHKPDFYRFLSAARLHRASYHWVVGSGRGGAEESLAESQKFMDDGSSLSSLVEEERQLKETSPFWGK